MLRYFILFLGLVIQTRISLATSSTNLDTLRVLSFNILYGGDEIDFQKVVEVIQKSNADIVGIQEAEGNLTKLAAALGWNYFDSRLHLLSKYPIYNDSTKEWYYGLVEIKPGKIVAISNIHLPSDPYGPDLIRDGATLDDVLRNEYELRNSVLDTFTFIFKDLAQRNLPMIVTGDFNSPSHRDWTNETRLLRPHMHYPVEWVVSKRMEEIGFIDSYRNYYTDPKQHPGITWTPASPPIVGNNETQDRIDFIWARGIDRVIQSTLIGEALSQDVSLAVTPFPSDHRAVSSTFLIEPVSTGAHIRAFPSSNSILVCFFGMDKPDLTIHIQSNYDTLVLPIYEIKPPSGEILVKDLRPGTYHISLYSGTQKLAHTNYVYNPEQLHTTLRLSKAVYQTGEPIQVYWDHAPENRYDWIAVYADTVYTNADYYQPEQHTNYLLYRYTGSKSSGSLLLDERATGKGWPLPAGQYRIHFLLDDGYTSITSIHLIIKN
jgi:exonuclease III